MISLRQPLVIFIESGERVVRIKLERLSLISQKVNPLLTTDDAPYLKSVVNVMKDSGCDVPEWMLKLKKPKIREWKNLKKNLKNHQIKRDSIKTISKYDENRIKKKSLIIEASKRRKAAAALQKMQD